MSPFLYLLIVLRGIVLGVQTPRWDLDPKALEPGEGVWVLLKEPDSIPPVLDVEVQEQTIPHARGHRESRKGVGAPCVFEWKFVCSNDNLYIQTTVSQK